MKVAISILLGFVFGFVTHLTFFGQPNIRFHWRLVERHNALVEDPASYKQDATTGLSVASPPDPMPSLAALVAAGELNHVDLVLPTVPASREAMKQCVTFCNTHKEIVYFTGNPSYTAFTPAGTQPVHLNLWFREADQGVVQTLIKALEESHAK